MSGDGGMGLSVLGMGWVTPHGEDLDTVWAHVLAGRQPPLSLIPSPFEEREAPVFRAPLPENASVGFARLRRASAISYFACKAAANAVAQAGSPPASKTALIFAATNGSVIYTRRFYADVVDSGSGSPLLFPETVYNAPASHVAARFGIDEPALTYVSDATAGVDALRSASELIHNKDVSSCIIVAAEEVDWITWDGFRRWGLASATPDSRRGAILSEGAVALVVGPAETGLPQIEFVHPGATYHQTVPLGYQLENLLRDLGYGRCPEMAILSAARTRLDVLEKRAFDLAMPGLRHIAPRKYLGEAFAVSTLAQVVCGLLALRDRLASRVVVSVLGWSGQLGGLSLKGKDTAA